VKVGLISDVHGDIASLDATLDLLAAQGADRVLCAGDLVDGSPGGDAVVARLRALRIPTVSGNHDSWARERQPTLPPNHPDRVSAATLDALDLLPFRLTVTLAGLRVSMVHACPWNQREIIHPGAPLARLQRVVTTAGDADVLVLGHTHLPMQMRMGRLWMVNPGSVRSSLPYDFINEIPRRRCALLSLPDLTLTVYDLDTGNPVPVEIVEID
jgi:putative phosphoesterase